LAEAGRLRDARQFTQAREQAERYMREKGDAPEWGNFLGHLAYLEGDAAKAKNTLKGVTERWPRFAKAHNNLAAIHWAEGERAPSLEHMASALELEPAQKDIVFNGTRILIAMGMKAEAKTLTEAYLKTHPADADTLTGILAG
jgi:predicted Zn-dependent protease